MSDLNSLLQDVLGVQKDVIAYHRDEIIQLMAKNFEAAEKAMRNKGPLIELYQAKMRALHERRAELSELGEAVREKLVAAQAEFDDVMDQYQHELDKALKSSQRVLDLIKNAMITHTSQSNFYGQSGSLTAGQETRSLTVNKSA